MVTIEQLRPERYAEAGALVARAFRNDPAFLYICPDDPELRYRQSAWMNERWARVLGPLGACEISQGGEGVAMWVPPSASPDPSLWTQIRTGLIWAPLHYRPRQAPRGLRLLADLTARHRAMECPHWELNILCVDPSAQRSGVGSALVRHGLERADRDGVPAYVITHNPANVAYYTRFGFEVVQQRSAETNRFFACTLMRKPGGRT
jgi:ribosomal protein S18 acetylase RimI-like enzyme